MPHNRTVTVPRPAPADSLVWLVSALLGAAGGVLLWQPPDLPTLTPHLWWPVVTVLWAAALTLPVHLPFGRDVHFLTLTPVALTLGLLFLPATQLAAAGLVAVGCIQLLVRRQPPIKLAFNAASAFGQLMVASHVFALVLTIGGTDARQLGPGTWLAALLATLSADLVGHSALFAVISIRMDAWSFRELPRTLLIAAVGTIVVTDLALVTAVVLRSSPVALALLAVVAMISVALYRGYNVQRLRYGRLELLYQFTGSVDRALQDESVLETVRAEACQLLRARSSSVVLCQPNSTQWWAPACKGEPVLLARGGDSPAHTLLRADGHLDAMAAPLRDGGEITGVFLVTDRLDDVTTFDRDDLKLFEALAGHASVALTNSGLVARVKTAAQETEHLSLHDPLTGLPNRLHFQQRLERRLLTDGSAAVLLMDVDRFKEVNDTLGHDVGDRLLREVGRRLRQVERGETVVARLGGDEFAVLLGGDDVHIEGMVARITRDMARPFDLGEVTLDVMASIGIASTPRDGSSAALLLRRAEVAMYDAKHGSTGVAHYDPNRDPYSSRRLSLIGDLARAVDESALELHYQPQADPATGQVTGVEALLRWNHPLWGNVPPDEFIPLAEHTGLIKPLTRFVIDTAVRQCVAWRDSGTPVLMAVNISMRNLLEPELADTVARMLVQAGLPAALLKLEVTESAIVSDPERAVTALERLVDLGLHVSVDDFGTGYSSLTRLRSLPVQEVKIDRSFVRHLSERDADKAIVRAVIGLGHDLGLRVVAEGVEDEPSWRLLREMECDLVQGYFLAKPMPATLMTGWLSEHFAAYATRIRSEETGTTAPVGEPAATVERDPRTGTGGGAAAPDVRRLRRI
jgi:diguanylate cyclase (GGDEF)-like protein